MEGIPVISERILAWSRISGRGLSCIALLALVACGKQWQPGTNAYVTVGGTVTGLTGSLVLCQGAACTASPPGGDTLTVSGNGPFTFAMQIANGSAYAVSIRTQPANEVCTLANASGTANGNVTSVTVTCHPAVTIGGTITGLVGTVVLTDTSASGASVLATASNGAFTFPSAVDYGATYAVTVTTQPTGQTCSVANGSGTATGAVTQVAVTCAANPSLKGTVTGLATGTTLTLLSSTGEKLTVGTNGAFAFANGVAAGSAYSVTVATPPAGEVCWIANDSGTAAADVSNVAVTCAAPVAPAVRPLPAIFASTRAVNYGPSRSCGPPCNELPSVADVEQDLGLLDKAGFHLLRIFGGLPAVSSEILADAQQNHPQLAIYLGSYLAGPNEAPACMNDATTPVQVQNLQQIDATIALANAFPNVAAVSVGNETALAGNQDVKCLAYYTSIVRTFVTQPVAVDDDYSFYAGVRGVPTNFGDPSYVASPEKPDSIFPLVDFVAIHEYPILLADSVWPTADWQQTSVAAGPQRAAAMMNASFTVAQQAYGLVSSYMTSHSVSLPIAVTETGWKAVATNKASAIENCCATPVNSKWYLDLMTAWSGSSGGPVAVFTFEAFDETWKGVDDGWGLWDVNRQPRYALCGTTAPSAPACTSPVYQGAGYFQ